MISFNLAMTEPSQPRIAHSRPTLTNQDAQAVADLVRSGFVGSGQRTREFEARLANRVGRASAVALSSGSAALHLALLALGVGRGDQVLLPALLCRAVLNVVLSIGAEPVLVDISPADLTMSLAAATRALTSKTKVILVPHMFGAPADLDGFLDLGRPVLEDAASSLGAVYHGRPVGSQGAASVFSFGSTKMLTTGQGGLVLIDDPTLLASLNRLKDYDSDTLTPTGYNLAYNYQFSDLQAALGLSQLDRLTEFIERRQQIATRYCQALADLPNLHLPMTQPNCIHSFYRFIVRLEGPSAEVAQDLAEVGIDARTSVAHFLYQYLDLPPDLFPACESIRHSLLSLPIYPELTDSQVDRVADTCRQSLAKRVAR